MRKMKKLVAEKIGAPAGRAVKTAADILIDEGIEKGIEKGIGQGFKKILERQLRRRFGKLDPNVRARLASANEAQLQEWADRVLVAKTVGDVFRLASRKR